MSSTTPPKLPIDQALRASVPPPGTTGLSRPKVVALAAILALLLASRMMCSADERSGPEQDGSASRAQRLSDEMIERGLVGGLPKDYGFMAQRTAQPPVQPAAPAEPEPDPIDPEEEKRRLDEQRAALDSPILFAPQRAQSETTNRPHALLGQRDRTGLQSPASPFTVQAGTIIPAVLVTAISSELPGTVVGRVAQSVYDSVRGESVLIPQGARLIGNYDSDVRYGQSRVLVVWNRLILPGGGSLDLGNMPGTDAAGTAGLTGSVDYHLRRIAGATMLSALVALGGNLAAGTGGERDAFDIAGQTAAQQASRVGNRIIDRELDVAPTIHGAAGAPFNVLVVRDFVLPPSTD